MKSRWGRLCGDAGDTLIELLVTVVIMGIAIVAIVGGMATSIYMSVFQRQQASEQTILRSYADAVESSQTSGWTGLTATMASYSPAAVGFTIPPAYGNSYTASATSIAFWNGTAFVGSAPVKDYGLQLVGLEVQGTRASESMSVVVRCLGTLKVAGGPCP